MEPIAVHGIGMVGGAFARYYQEKKIPVLQYDPPKGMEDDLREARIHFLCVPTPYQKDGIGFDLQYVLEAMKNIEQARGDKETVVIIKSTVLPGTTESIQKQYPKFILLFNPEFLTEKNADKDMKEPDRQILGYVDERGQKVCNEVMSLLPPAPFRATMSATEAELVKYFGNAFLATKVIFSNMMYDFCQALGLDYEKVAEAAAHDIRIGSSHMKVVHDGYRGYGGSCFPKDVRALIQKGEALGVDVGLLKEAERRNHDLTGGVDR
jgi:UDPglucose 6-dehydrogenase